MNDSLRTLSDSTSGRNNSTRRPFSIIRIIFAVIIGICMIPVLCIAYWILTYNSEMYSIENKLNAIPGVSVVNIWGHQDITLEEVSARLNVQGKGKIVLYGLSKDVVNYPDRVTIYEINGMSFKVFYSNTVGNSINIGRKGIFNKFFPFTLNSEEDVVRRYDEISQTISSWPAWPDLFHFYTNNGAEIFVAVLPIKKSDDDPIFDLIGIEDLIKFKNTLPWGKAPEGRVVLKEHTTPK